jgi:nucleotide-binding universal stress UspA family protein
MARVLLAYDGGPSAMRAVDHIAQSPLYKGLEVTVVSVGEAAQVAAGLSDAQARLKAAGIAAAVRNVTGQPETALAKLVEDESFQMLVMGAYGHSRIRSLIIGSTTTEMIRSCKVPIMLVR